MTEATMSMLTPVNRMLLVYNSRDMAHRDPRFLDQAPIHVRAGDGGNGKVNFRREKFVSLGGPDGGDGGQGGSVYLVANPTLNTLVKFQRNRRFQAGSGRPGGSSHKTGRNAADLEISVPLGTVVRNAATKDILGDLVDSGHRLLVAQGGRGGRGNARFKTSSNKAPRIADKGELGEDRDIILELRLIADVGIVGVPNAGKSTFLSAVSAARPKIASYPFTTLIPNLGVADLGDYNTLVLADIPGLIEGAHTGAGLGFEFLRHVQRTRVLIHILDGLSDNPLSDFSQTMSELKHFDDNLADKPQVIALNKVDLPEVDAKFHDMRAECERLGYELYRVSAIKGQGLRELLGIAFQLLSIAPPSLPFDEIPIYRPAPDDEAFEVTREMDGSFRIKGNKIERAAQMTYWEYEDAVIRFQRTIEALGVHRALRHHGVKDGDTVRIGDHELEWTE